MFVELPAAEAYAPLYLPSKEARACCSWARSAFLPRPFFLARRMVGPIQALRTGAARIGSGDFSQRISIKTGDELEALADQFNEMGGPLAGIRCRPEWQGGALRTGN